jgi:hypothetical protein
MLTPDVAESATGALSVSTVDLRQAIEENLGKYSESRSASKGFECQSGTGPRKELLH